MVFFGIVEIDPEGRRERSGRRDREANKGQTASRREENGGREREREKRSKNGLVHVEETRTTRGCVRVTRKTRQIGPLPGEN